MLQEVSRKLLNSWKTSIRFQQMTPPIVCILGALLIFVLSLGTYCLHYFPFEDDFSLIRSSAIQNAPRPESWITKGFSDYFANDPQCATRDFGFDRPVANATFYLESLLYRRAEGPILLLTNVLCWIVSAWFMYAIARRLGASNWIASAGSLLYALSPCWYRDLLHASFRNNGLAACFLLAASYVLLKEGAVRSLGRVLLAGILIALAAGAHEQGFTSLPVFALGVAWLCFKEDGQWRWGRTLAASALVVAPSLLMLECFRVMNPLYGTSYVTTGFLGSMTQSRHLASLGIHSPVLIGMVKLAVHVCGALISALSAFTPVGSDNFTRLSGYSGIIIFVLAMMASFGVLKQFPRQKLPVAALILYAFGRSFGIPSAEPRFTHMEVAWGIIALMCAWSAALASANRVAIVAGSAAALGLLAFDAASWNASILMRHGILMTRNEVDHEAFDRIEAAGSRYPGAQVVLINDQAAVESSRAMLKLAGFDGHDLSFSPTITNAFSIDTLRDVRACETTTEVLRLPTTLQIHLDYPKGCGVYFFGRDLACMVGYYRSTGLLHSVDWASSMQQPETQHQYPPPLIADISLTSDHPLVVIAWRDRLTTPDVFTLPDESVIPADWKITH